MFYTFAQNNSGGKFHEDENVTHYVIIEAGNAEQANHYAEMLGIYFDGSVTERDCPCCGNRWYRVDESDGTPTPTVYGEDVEPENIIRQGIVKIPSDRVWNNVIIHYAD